MHVPILLKLAKEFDCVVIGPGLGEKAESKTAVRMLCENITVPKVIDADALKAKPKLKMLNKKSLKVRQLLQIWFQ